MAEYPSKTPENGANFTSIIHRGPYPYLDAARHVGHNILITGGTRGIGRAVAVAFARAGASAIVVADISEDYGALAHDLIEAAKEKGFEAPQIILHRLDVTDEESVRACAALVGRELGGRLDVLVNNAGFMTPALEVPDSDAETWWRTLEVNLKGPYLMSKHFIPMLLLHSDDDSDLSEEPSGGVDSRRSSPRTLINVNSVAAHNLRPRASAYGTSKFAVLKLTEFLLVEAAERGLVAYSVHPGGVLTELAEKGMPAETLAALTDEVALPAAAIAWLTSERRDWLSGRYLSATWDMEELVGRKEEIVRGDKLKVRLVV
ncbi:oxidoreductase-like protein [Xylariales sp. PMI_506]|nr:oxidoreductase-like protein [Xylariales sp. PMI_506]